MTIRFNRLGYENINTNWRLKKLDEISHCKEHGVWSLFPQAPRGPPAIFLISRDKRRKNTGRAPRCSSKVYPFSRVNPIGTTRFRESPLFLFNLFLFFFLFIRAYFLVSSSFSGLRTPGNLKFFSSSFFFLNFSRLISNSIRSRIVLFDFKFLRLRVANIRKRERGLL